MSHRIRVFVIGALAAGFAIAWTAEPASAQEAGELSPAQELGSPTGEPSPEPDPTTLDVPPPPGADVGVRAQARYPLATPEQAARTTIREPTIRIPSRITTRLRALDANLQSLSARGGGNIVNAVLSLLTGGLSITLGALRPNNTDAMSIYLYVYGSTAAVRGALDFALTPNAQGAAITYQHMPMSTHEDVRERLAYGERALGGLAEQSLIARVLDASLNIAAGVAVVPIYLVPSNFEIVDPVGYFILIGAGVSIVSGIITLASTSIAEQRWGAYQELRERLATESREERQSRSDGEDQAALLIPRAETHFSLSAAPSPTGFFGGLSLTF